MRSQNRAGQAVLLGEDGKGLLHCHRGWRHRACCRPGTGVGGTRGHYPRTRGRDRNRDLRAQFRSYSRRSVLPARFAQGAFMRRGQTAALCLIAPNAGSRRAPSESFSWRQARPKCRSSPRSRKMQSAMACAIWFGFRRKKRARSNRRCDAPQPCSLRAPASWTVTASCLPCRATSRTRAASSPSKAQW